MKLFFLGTKSDQSNDENDSIHSESIETRWNSSQRRATTYRASFLDKFSERKIPGKKHTGDSDDEDGSECDDFFHSQKEI